MVVKELKLANSMGYTIKDFEEVVQKMGEGEINPRGMITGRIPLSKTKEDGIEVLINDKDAHVKILVQPSSS